jgi:hypothetical protein
MSFVGGGIAWRLPIGCQMIFAVVGSRSAMGARNALNHPGGHHPRIWSPRESSLLLQDGSQRRGTPDPLRCLRQRAQ